MFLSCTSVVFSQNSSKKNGEVRIGVGVEDSFTNVGLPAFVTLLNCDSVVIDTATCKVYRTNSFALFYIPRVSGTYIVNAEYPGYQKYCKKEYFDFPKNIADWGLGTIKLKRLPTQTDSIKSKWLDEVIVRGTRLQIAYRGDTIVYDAQAFNIPEYAMLDALVKQLPGAELKINGDVYINGKKLDYITLNGNDFYKGSNKIILENLPYFTVKELLVYHKDPPFALTKPTTDNERDYVLDVIVKREYAIGSITNTEVGIGSDERWKNKCFFLSYDDHKRLSMFGNINNTNEDRTPGNDGDWSPKKQQRGLLTTKQTGLNLNVNNAKKTITLDQSTIFEWTDKNTTLRRYSETFGANTNAIEKSSLSNNIKNFSINNQTKADWKIGKSLFCTQHNITYTNNNSSNLSADSTYLINLINIDNRNSVNKIRSVSGNGSLMWSALLFGSNATSIIGNYSFNSLLCDNSHSLCRTHYINTDTIIGKNEFRDNKSQKYNFRVSLSQDLRISRKVSLDYNVGYDQSGEYGVHNIYNIHQSIEQYKNELFLPSSTDSLAYMLDEENSYNYFTFARNIVNSLSFRYSWKNTSANISARYTYTHERIHYFHDQLDTITCRKHGNWHPYVSLQHKWRNNVFRMNCSVITSQPAFVKLMPLTDNSYPLNVRINNPNLRSQQKYLISAELNKQAIGRKPALRMKFETTIVDRAYGNRIKYNTTTGGYTIMADNVNGNWNTLISFGANGIIDEKKHLRYEITTRGGFIHNVDLAMAYNDEDNILSRVNTFK